VCSVVTPFVIKLHKTSGIKAQYCNLIQQPRFLINFKDYKPNKFPFGSKWTMFYQLPLPALLLTDIHHSQARLFILYRLYCYFSEGGFLPSRYISCTNELQEA
jgi:hypothetical protein